MNRVSILFAVILAASFAVLSTPTGNMTPGSGTATQGNRNVVPSAVGKASRPAGFISQQAQAFISDFRKRERDRGVSRLEILFVTVPDPIETQLAAMFDHNVAALQDGAADSGYVFDSSWIPWEDQHRYGPLAGTLAAERARAVSHEYPGVVLFRGKNLNKYDKSKPPAEADLLVFLLAEKPTAGIAVKQVANAVSLLAKNKVPIGPEIRILGPSFSGSLSSMVEVLRILTTSVRRPGSVSTRALIRSGGISEPEAVKDFVQQLHGSSPKLQVDVGSSAHPSDDLLDIALKYLQISGVDGHEVAVLTESESQFGQSAASSTPHDRQLTAWKVPFPRDISTLRASYQKQQVLETGAPTDALKHYLHITEEDEREGDSVRTMGGPDTVMSEESVLFGITGFLRSHHIRAAIIIATSEADRYFLAQFMHANSPEVRVVILGSTRLFMRGSTSQFRGDMMVSDFPMLARLSDWTNGPNSEHSARIFPDDTSQGTYVAALDLLPLQPVVGDGIHPPPEYSGLPWGEESKDPQLRQAPPVYISALGGDSAWPIWTTRGTFLKNDVPQPSSANALPSQPADRLTKKQNGSVTASETRSRHKKTPPPASSASQFAMPFLFGRHFGPASGAAIPQEQASKGAMIHTGHLWRGLFWMLWCLAEAYIIAIFYANPVVRRRFAYLQPTDEWRYWIFALALPSLCIGCGFLVLAWAHRFPYNVLQSTADQFDFLRALVSSVAIPLVLAAVCVIKSRSAGFLGRPLNLLIAFASTGVLTIMAVGILVWHRCHIFATGEILATYRQMYWESGLSLVPSMLLLLGALVVWAYFGAVGTSLLRCTWRLPQFHFNGRISFQRGIRIIRAARPLPLHAGSRWYLIIAGCTAGVMFVICRYWPSFSDITSLETKTWTHRVLCLGFVVAFLMLMDLLQFAWVWAELRDLLMALDREQFKRSFVPFRDYGWSSLWSFSAGSFQDLRNRLAEQVDSVRKLGKEWDLPNLVSALKPFELRRRKYNRPVLEGIPVRAYYRDLEDSFQDLSDMGTAVSWLYIDYINHSHATKPRRAFVVSCCEHLNDRFQEEKAEIDELPEYERCIERFLCLIYVGFIQTVIARLRGLAFSIVSLFSLMTLSIAVYPFQPMQTLLGCSMLLFVLIAVTSIVVYSQMDKDPILARVLNSDPHKLERSFYSKVIETLMPPLLALTTSLLPGGAGRLIDVVGKLFGSAHP